MSGINTHYQAGQQLGPGTIVNPSEVTSKQLENAKLVTLLVPNSLEKNDSLQIQVQSAQEKKTPLIQFNPQTLAEVALSASIGGLIGMATTAITKSPEAGLAMAAGTTGLGFAAGMNPMTAIDIVGGAVVGGLAGGAVGAVAKSMPVGLGVSVGVGVLAFTISRAMGNI